MKKRQIINAKDEQAMKLLKQEQVMIDKACEGIDLILNKLLIDAKLFANHVSKK